MTTKTQRITVPAAVAGRAGSQEYNGEGLWFECRKMTGGDDPVLRTAVLGKDRSKQMADGSLKIYDGDVFEYDQPFSIVTLFNDLAFAITFEITVSNEGRHRVQADHVSVDNIPTFAAGSIPTTQDVTLPPGGPTLILPVNLARRSAKITGHRDNAGVPPRIGDLNVAADQGDPVEPKDAAVMNTTAAIYGYNDTGADQKVCCIEALN